MRPITLVRGGCAVVTSDFGLARRLVEGGYRSSRPLFKSKKAINKNKKETQNGKREKR